MLSAFEYYSYVNLTNALKFKMLSPYIQPTKFQICGGMKLLIKI